MMSNFKASIIGAGSTYTPELIEGFLERLETLPFDCISLMDIDENRLNLLADFTERQLRAGGYTGKIERTTAIDRAVDGASFVFGQVRVGQMQARIQDEKIPLKYGLIGQETTGIGGFMKALRTVPVIMNVAEEIKKRAEKDAWLINFSNPSGIIAQSVLNHTDVNMIGLCNCPVNMLKDVTNSLGTDEYEYEYVGLNHLSWITSVIKHGDTENIVAGLANPTGARMTNIPEVDFDPALLHAIPYIPSYYLSYFYKREEQLKHCIEAKQTRGEICVDVEKELFLQFEDKNLTVKPPEIAKRGGALYSTAAIKAVESIANNKGEYHVVAAKNNGALPFMADDDVIEVKCKLDKSGVTPQKVTVYNEYIVGLMTTIKAYERLAVKAAMNGSYDDAIKALMLHPLVGDFDKAKGAFDELLECNREYLGRFFK